MYIPPIRNQPGFLAPQSTVGIQASLYEKYGARFATYRKDWARASQREWVPDFPLHLELEINNTCNLRCKMCHFAAYTHNAGGHRYMSLDRLQQIMSEVDGNLPAALIGTGAEPLMHPHIIPILSRVMAAGVMDCILSTNGMLLSEDIARTIVELEIARLNISLDAATQATFARIRGGNLEVIEENIARFLEIRTDAGQSAPYLRVSFVIQDENRHEIEAFRQKWSGIADKVDFQTLLPITTEGTDDAPDPARITGNCAHPFQRLAINYDGQIFPCCTYYSRFLPMGTIGEQSIALIWQSDRMKCLRESLQSRKFYRTCCKCLSYSS